MRTFRIAILAALLASMGACSSGNDQKKGGNVFKTQTEALEKAKQVEQIEQQDADRQRKAIEQQTQ